MRRAFVNAERQDLAAHVLNSGMKGVIVARHEHHDIAAQIALVNGFDPREAIAQRGGLASGGQDAHLVHRVSEHARQVKGVKDDLASRIGDVRHRRVEVRFPHVHGHGLHLRQVFGRHLQPKRVQGLLLASVKGSVLNGP